MRVPRSRSALTTQSDVVFACGIAFWLAILGVATLVLWNVRAQTIVEAKARGSATTALLQAHTANTFRAVQNVLGEVARTLSRDELPRHHEGLRNELRKRISSMPYVRAVFVIGLDGRIQHDTDYPATPDVSLADRPYFKQYLDDEQPSSISSPILSRSGVGWFVAVTQPIGDGATFRGVAVAAMQLTYFSELYRQVGLGEGSEILLFHKDGTLIAQHPGESGKIGESYAGYPLFQEWLPRSPWGAYLTEGKPLPYLRTVDYATVTDAPLVVAQAQNIDLWLAGWRNAAWASGGAMVLLLFAIMYAARRYVQHRFARAQHLDRVVQAEKMEALGQLTGGIAHDFANVLGVVATNIALLKRLGGLGDRTEAALARAQRALDNGTALTRQLMTFSRKRELQISVFDLNEAISSFVGLLEHAAGPEHKLVFEPGKLAGPCRLDRTQLETSLINLVVNARHAMERDGLITISTRRVSGSELNLRGEMRKQMFVCVSVVDTGKGMTEEVRRRATEPFFTTKGEQGTGFGLAQVYSFMQQLGGDLTIESQVGVGTAVHLRIPESAIEGGPAGSNVATSG